MPLPTVILPGFFAGASEYRRMEQGLNDLGFPTVTVPLRRQDWWPTVGGRSMIPILRLFDYTVQRVLREYQTSHINLIGHSAGGWIARIYLGEKPYVIHGDVTQEVGLWHKHPTIATLVTLGTPHYSLNERWTRKNLNFVNDHYPGAFYPEVQYVCVAGKAIQGARCPGQWLAYNSYQLTCGKGDAWGDGITPVEAAHLEGAKNIVLDDVMHSPRRAGLWYGSPDILPAWVSYLQ